MNKPKIKALLKQLAQALEDDEDEKPTPAPGTAEAKKLAARNAQRERMNLPPLGRQPAALRVGVGEFTFSQHALAQSRTGRARA